MRFPTAPVFATTGLLLALGCASSDVPVAVSASPDGPAFTGPAPTLTTDRTSYVAIGDSGTSVERQWRFTVITTLRNNSAQTLYIDRCGSSLVYGVVGSDARSAYSPIWACAGGSIGATVAAYATRVDTLTVVGPTSFDGTTHQGIGATSGTMALSYALATCTDVGGCHAGTIAAISQRFAVNAAP